MPSAEEILIQPGQFCQNLGQKKNLLLIWHLMVAPHCYTGINLNHLQFFIHIILVLNLNIYFY